MDFRQENIGQFYVMGVSTRTTNAGGQSQKDIGDLWAKFMSDNISERMSNKLSEDIYCVYTEYESDYTGCYTVIIGYKVAHADIVPDGLVVAPIKKGKYQIYSPQGKFPDSVITTWIHIWQSDIDRNYTTDFDCYKAGALSFEDTKAEVYIAVK